MQSKLSLANVLRMVRWITWHCPPDTGAQFEPGLRSSTLPPGHEDPNNAESLQAGSFKPPNQPPPPPHPEDYSGQGDFFTANTRQRRLAQHWSNIRSMSRVCRLVHSLYANLGQRCFNGGSTSEPLAQLGSQRFVCVGTIKHLSLEILSIPSDVTDECGLRPAPLRSITWMSDSADPVHSLYHGTVTWQGDKWRPVSSGQ